MGKDRIKINLFITRQMCVCDSDPDCCAAPGQSEREIAELAGELKKIAQVNTVLNEIRDIRVMDKFPRAAALFKKYGYNCLPIIMVDNQIVTYGIPDKEFIVNSVKKIKLR